MHEAGQQPTVAAGKPADARQPAGPEELADAGQPAGAAGTLELDHLHRRYGDVIALDGLTFAVPPGQVFGFLGPNGAGKTTTMRATVGMARLAGTIYERAILRTGSRLRVRQVLRSAR